MRLEKQKSETEKNNEVQPWQSRPQLKEACAQTLGFRPSPACKQVLEQALTDLKTLKQSE